MPSSEEMAQEDLLSLSDDISSQLQALNDSSRTEFNEQKLRAFAFEREKQKNASTIESLKKDGFSEKAINNIISHLVSLTYKYQPDLLFIDFAKSKGCWNGSVVDPGREDRILKLTKEYEQIFIQDNEDLGISVEVEEEINKPVRIGGGTELHVAAEEGNMERVIYLVEQMGASVFVKDNANMKPSELANYSGRFQVAAYLKAIEKKAELSQ